MVVVLLYSLGSILQEKKKDEHHRGKEGSNRSPLLRWGVWTSIGSLFVISFAGEKYAAIY